MRAAARLLLLLVVSIACSAVTTATSTPAANPPLRIWIDEFFFSEGETQLLREAAAASGGAALVAGTTHNRVLQLKSYQRTGAVDVLWTGPAGCYEAFRRQLNATHAVSCVPGSQAMTDKAALVGSLAAAYGPAAWGVVPRSFRLPAQYGEMAAHLKREHAAGHSSLWVLKEDVHRGKGVAVVSPAQLLARALERAPGSGWFSDSWDWSSLGSGSFAGWQRLLRVRVARQGWRGVLAHVWTSWNSAMNQFLGEQYLVGGRPFYIRVWAVVMGADPARAYLYDGGVVVFGQQQKRRQAGAGNAAGSAASAASDTAAGGALIVNLWTQDRQAAAPWSLGQLEAHLAAGTGSRAAPQRLRSRLHAAAAAALAAAVPSVRRAAAGLPGYQGGSFEVLGIDFLLDASLRPWVVEVNALPSMARKVVGSSGSGNGGNGSSTAEGPKHSSSAAEQQPPSQASNPFDAQKEGFVSSLLQLLIVRHHQQAAAEQQAAQLLQAASAEAAEEQGPPCVGAAQLRQLLALPQEQAAAERLGFIPLTSQLYDGLACMAARPVSGSPDAADSSWCNLLADLQPPVPAGEQQCSADAQVGGGSALGTMARLQQWAGRLQLEAASLLPAVLHPRAWRQGQAGAALPPPKPVSDADRRMLAWLRRGLPQLSSVPALLAYCDA
ncbi:tubulin tyrosine ligase-like member 5 [Chlorella sorokiniana]|uniref:Tubulin--tyrosine ligase-like protein 5 n=1 Tax=Chlorella sorokiniana TaxID=3076 RepID=A0A2P6TTZ4_CHLSO|nr:tubulin tyrosine ligase-like member 5 [Chlorella sorokiniana]|eukprot:PRW57529.1 tubulin tyrosine ligase-like member 5 [Chlorella sorokiniana]